MVLSNLKILLEDYLASTDSMGRASLAVSIADEVFKRGFDATSIDIFSRKYTQAQKQELISAIFENLQNADSIERFQLIDTLSSFLLETNLHVKDQIMPIYLVNLKQKKQFTLVFTTLKIFTSRWDEFTDEMKRKLFEEFLSILENPYDLFVEEGMFEITDLILSTKSTLDPNQDLFDKEDLDAFLRRLIEILLKGEADTVYAALESMKQILEARPSLVSKELYIILSPMFKRFKKAIALFYPAKRDFIRTALSFLDVILFIEQAFPIAALSENLHELMVKIAKKIDHADVKYLLERILYILKRSVYLDKLHVIRPTLIILRDLHNKETRLESYFSQLLNEIINKLWPILSDKEKEIFFQETEFGNSVI